MNHVNTLRGSLNVLNNLRIFSPEGGSAGKQRQSSQITVTVLPFEKKKKNSLRFIGLSFYSFSFFGINEMKESMCFLNFLCTGAVCREIQGSQCGDKAEFPAE